MGKAKNIKTAINRVAVQKKTHTGILNNKNLDKIFDYIEKTKSRQAGITLVALIVTIIVLLILTGITITLALNDNGVVGKAQHSFEIYALKSAEEKVNLAYTTVKEEIISQVLNDVNYNASSNENTEILGNIVRTELPEKEWFIKTNIPGIIYITYYNDSIEGKLESYLMLDSQNVILYIDGKRLDNIGNDNNKKSVLELKEGEEINYIDCNGNIIPCIVLYGSDSEDNYGIQIVTKSLVKDSNGNDVTVELGNGTGISQASYEEEHFEKARESYNTETSKLNRISNEYLNTDLAEYARSIGSNPSAEPILDEENTGNFTSNIIQPYNYNNKFKRGFGSGKDGTQMRKVNINCYKIGKNYWEARGGTYTVTNKTAVLFRTIAWNGSGTCFDSQLCAITSEGVVSSCSNTYGLRPVFKLKSDIYYIEVNNKKILTK